MTKFRDEFYLVLQGRGNRGFQATKLTRNKPSTAQNEVAVKLQLAVDSTVFQNLIPVVDIELGERELFVTSAVEVNALAKPVDSPEEDSEEPQY